MRLRGWPVRPIFITLLRGQLHTVFRGCVSISGRCAVMQGVYDGWRQCPHNCAAYNTILMQPWCSCWCWCVVTLIGLRQLRQFVSRFSAVFFRSTTAVITLAVTFSFFFLLGGDGGAGLDLEVGWGGGWEKRGADFRAELIHPCNEGISWCAWAASWVKSFPFISSGHVGPSR